MLIKIGTVVAIGLLWAASMIYIYRDMSDRNLPGWEQSIWVIVSLVPFLGFAAYLIARLTSRPARMRQAVAVGEGSPRMTMLQEPGQRLPTVAMSAGRSNAVGREAALRVNLSITDGVQRGQEFTVEQFPTCIGRESDCGVRLDQDLAVSRRHAELSMQGDRLWIKDLQSRHGTFVNGKRVTEHQLSRGDKVWVGNSQLVIKIGR